MTKIIKQEYLVPPNLCSIDPLPFPEIPPAPPGTYFKEMREKEGVIEYIYEEDDSQEDDFESYINEMVEERVNNILVEKIKVQASGGNDADKNKHSEELSEEIYLTEEKVSKITKIAIQTLRNHRSKGCGIPYTKSGRSVRYRLKDVLQYMGERRIKTK